VDDQFQDRVQWWCLVLEVLSFAAVLRRTAVLIS